VNLTQTAPIGTPITAAMGDLPSTTSRSCRRSRLASRRRFPNSTLLRQLVFTALTPRHGAFVTVTVFPARVATIPTTLPSPINDRFGLHQQSSSEVSPDNNWSRWSEESFSRS
jgi:hypothetical protein